MKYEITIRQITPYTADEIGERNRDRRDNFSLTQKDFYSDSFYHEVRVLHAEVSKEEFEKVKKAIIAEM